MSPRHLVTLSSVGTRTWHYALLAIVWAVLCLPNLGGPSLWDIDEGNNAECAQEMYESGNFIVPTFNYNLRVDKPVLLYWLQALAYHGYGISEFAARLPSALASLLSLLVVYELGRRLFERSAALLAGLILAGSVAFCTAAHFANPDALLNLCVLLSLWCFWNHYTRRGWWLLGAGAACGLGMLAKGPVAVILPMMTTTLFFLIRRELRRLWDLHLLGAALVFVIIAAPWYVWVGVETKGEWLAGFFWKHNVERATGILENHGGPFFYYVLVLLVGLAPWSIFLYPAIRYPLSTIRQGENAESRQRTAGGGPQFLLCWVAVWLLFFTVVRTKLPNYILPVYPAVALLTASFLDDWRRGRLTLAPWMMPTSLACLALAGIGIGVGLLIAGDALPFALHGRRLPGLEKGAWLGGVFLLGAIPAAWCVRRGRRGGLIGCVAASGIVFTAALAFWGVNLVDRFKAPRPLVQALPEDHLYREVRVGAIGYFQPSLVFYCQREVQCPENMVCAIEFLHTPLPVYVFASAEMWEQLRIFAPQYRLLARHRDLYNGREVLLLTNEPLN
ncbi:MAG TPA: glycosyltransferase family 39 protein [Gemmataceae bacterium]|nr:glycosyltransferase family 39 protein [Gemmataceae bacterium]